MKASKNVVITNWELGIILSLITNERANENRLPKSIIDLESLFNRLDKVYEETKGNIYNSVIIVEGTERK